MSGNLAVGNIARAAVFQNHSFETDLCELQLFHSFFGHRGSITALCASPALGLLVSGSLDRRVIIWDANRLVMITVLPLHPSHISALSINSISGDIVSCAGACAFVWSSTGHLTASNNMATGSNFAQNFDDTCEMALTRLTSAALSTTDIILSVTFVASPIDGSDVYLVTGHKDGAVRFWKLELLGAKPDATRGIKVFLGLTSFISFRRFADSCRLFS